MGSVQSSHLFASGFGTYREQLRERFLRDTVNRVSESPYVALTPSERKPSVRGSCGWCIPYLKRYFEQSRAGGDLADAISKEQYARDRAAYIKAGKGTPAAGAIPLPDAESGSDELTD